MTRVLRHAAIGAFALGLVLRFAILSQTTDLGTPILDEQQFARLGSSLVRGEGFAWGPDQPTSLRPPLYPAVLAGIWHIAGDGHLQAVRLVQILLAALTSLAVYALGRRVFTREVALVAAAGVWLYPSLLFFNVTILTETLFTLLLTLFVLLVVSLVQRPRADMALIAGLALGLAALTRSVLWPMPLLLCPLLLVLLHVSWRTRLVCVALVAVGFAVPVAPWAVRNTRLQGVTTIVDTMGGMNLRMGNYEHTPDDRMWDAVALSGEKAWTHGIEHAFPYPPTEGEKEKWAQRQAIAYMAAHPGVTLRRGFIKFADFWGLEREFPAGIAKGLYSPPAWFGLAGSLLVILGSALVMLAGGAGIWLAAPDRRIHALLLLPIVLIMGVHTIVFGHSRYHVPLVPILALYGSSLLLARDAWRRAPRALRYGASVTIAVLLAIWARELVIEAARIRGFLG
jgi:4-amino-4-deoxy-L-arabinose transferase-like glycosyltransferase